MGGKPLLNRLALQVKTKANGSLKVRLITDLLRSQGNWFLRAPERIVLPRLVEAIESALYILDGIELDILYGLIDRTTTAEWGSADVKDAFFNIQIFPSWRETAGRPAIRSSTGTPHRTPWCSGPDRPR